MQVDDVGVFHLRQDVDLFLDVFPGHSSSGGLQTLLLDVLGRILVPGRLLDDTVDVGELSAEKEKDLFLKMARGDFSMYSHFLIY